MYDYMVEISVVCCGIEIGIGIGTGMLCCLAILSSVSPFVLKVDFNCLCFVMFFYCIAIGV